MKKIISKCHAGKRFQRKPFTATAPGYLPKSRTKQNLPFRIIGTDYEGPIYCKTEWKREVKVYLLVFTCGIFIAIPLEMLTNQNNDKIHESTEQTSSKKVEITDNQFR